ncbi:LOW QUALITY PROTEIN: hypothetical protein PHMEG_00036325 [Phytophthora megakarya]|uniref:Uncharacterized protein n=1 Tax=Phytophthora megakarya TaxID=4795 RepID=A0A225UM12_9STRA|nr:LOW QUALITY PROTEIN: hypothetical protein PHMEG_00036325 [Phytophthora megakarya]
MDEFGVYLAVHTGAKERPLSRHSATQCFCQGKCWVLDEYPGQGGAVELQMFSLGRTHKQHCIMCACGGFVKKAAACTKESLKNMTSYLYSSTTCGLDYQDAALWSSLAPLLNHLPVKSKGVLCALTESIPLLDLLYDGSTLGSSQVSSTNCSTSAKPVAEIHALVNRLLDCVAGPAGVEDAHLTCFNEVHANAGSEPTAPWIFDRGIWNMTTANKAFAYVFNTTKEDHYVAKVLSGNLSPRPAAVTQEQVREVSYKLFNASHGFANKAFNFSSAGLMYSQQQSSTITRG